MKYLTVNMPEYPVVGYQQKNREYNLKRAFDIFRSGRCTSRSELASILKLSPTAASLVVEDMEKLNLIKVRNGSSRKGTQGRPPVSLEINNAARQIVSFTLSRKGIDYLLMDLACAQIEHRFVPVSGPEHPEFAWLFEQILKESQAFDPANTIVIGLCFPGVYLEKEEILSLSAAMDITISERSIRDFEDRIGIPIFIANNSMCLAYAEKKLREAGTNRELRDMMFINVCDGVGAGIILEGKICTGPSNAAGEFGHITIDPNGPVCMCGNRGCLERYLNHSAVLKAMQTACRQDGAPVPETIMDITPEMCGGKAARETINNLADILGKGIYTLVCVTGINHIAIGGGIEVLGPTFLNRIRDTVINRNVLTKSLSIEYALIGPEGSGIGLANYFLDKSYRIIPS